MDVPLAQIQVQRNHITWDSEIHILYPFQNTRPWADRKSKSGGRWGINSKHYTWRQASERKVCTHLWEYYLIQQVDRPTQPNFSIRHSCSENSFLYSILLASQCPWWHFVMTSFGKGHYNKFHFFSEAWSLPLSWNRAASPRCWARLMISDISLIITSPRHHHLSFQVWSLINNPWGRVVASQACHMICSLMRSSHNQH